MRSPPALTALRLAALALTLPFSLSAQPTAPRVRIAEELRLDAASEDFPTVSRIFVGPRGQIVVPITQDMQLRIYDATGKRVAAVGRRGAGPGEFQSMSIAGWLGDTLWVSDIRQRRTTFIGPDYKVLRTDTWPQGEGDGRLAFFDPLALLEDGSMVGQAFRRVSSGGQDEMRGVLLHRSRSGAARTLLEMPREQDQPWIMWVAGLGQSVPFALSPQYAFTYDGTRIAQLTAPIPKGNDGRFSLLVLGPRGDTLAQRDFPFRGVPIPKRAVDSALAAFIPKPGASRHEGTPADLPKRFQALARERMPSVYTPVETVLLGLDNTIWLGMRPTDEGREMLILNGRAEPIGTLMLPASTRVRQATGTHVWVTETDADGLSSVVRYRIVGLSCGPQGC